MTRLRRIRFEFFPQLSDKDPQIFRALLRVLAPHGFEQPSMFDDAVGPSRKIYEQLEFLGRQPHLTAADVYSTRLEIDPEVADLERRHIAGVLGRAPAAGTH